ncbi:MAG: hypothetical protein H6681_02330 [Desulfobacteraceae bacterium]|nr:hypothetical protein [Desulfobacteraceae bacterium]MCB9494263.1 hypothetical protein [Desulfobacteraceae bacterium]
MSKEIWSNTDKNILYLAPGELDKKDYNNFAKEVEKEAAKLKKGFICINDLRNFSTDWSTVTEEDVEIFKSGQKKLKELGMENAIRILGNQPKFVVDFFESEDDKGYLVSNVDSYDQAEELLRSMA